MKTICLLCQTLGKSKVIDSRPARGATAVRRRRECYTCRGRFTTYEGAAPAGAQSTEVLKQLDGTMHVMRAMVNMYDKAKAEEVVA